MQYFFVWDDRSSWATNYVGLTLEGGRASLRSDLEEVAIQIGQGIRTGGNQCMYCDRVGMLRTEPSLTIQTLEIKMT